MGSEPISTLRAVSEPPENGTVPQPDGEADAQAPAALAVRVRAAAAPPVSRLSRGLSRDGAAAAPTVQAAAVGFLAGAAVLGLVHRRHRRAIALARGAPRRRLGRRARRARRKDGIDLLQIVGSRSLLVDVHLLGAPADR
jgi:hypothetical protein